MKELGFLKGNVHHTNKSGRSVVKYRLGIKVMINR